MNTVIIKQLRLNDADDFFNLRLEALKNSPTSFLASYEEEKKSGPDFFVNILKNNNDDNVIFGAFRNSDLVGIIGLYQEKHSRLKHKATLWGTYITPKMRSIGIAKKLIESAVNHARNKIHCTQINLTVGSKNTAAKKLYESVGFTTWGIEVKGILIDDNFYDEDYMVLSL